MTKSLMVWLGEALLKLLGFALLLIYALLAGIVRHWQKILTGVALVVFFVVAGCSTQTRVVDHYINVDRPVPVPCDAIIPDPPNFAVTMIKEGDSLPYIADAYLIERHQRIGYEKQLVAALTACLARPVKGTVAAPGKAVNKSTGAGE